MAVTELPARAAPAQEHSVFGALRNKINRVSILLEFLYAQRVIGFTVGDQPEFEAASVPLFLERLASAGSYLEFGSGGSTVLAAKAGIPFVVVESDPVFLKAVRKKLIALEAFDPRMQTFVHADIGLTEAWGAPVMHGPTPQRVARWRRYPEAPWSTLTHLPGPYLVLVDGRFRAACALQAAKFLSGRAGEVLIDDYVDREYYHGVEEYLDLVETAGRMALFKPRANVNMAALDAAILRYSADFR